MQEYAITNDKTKRPVALRTKTLADLLECKCDMALQINARNIWFYWTKKKLCTKNTFCKISGICHLFDKWLFIFCPGGLLFLIFPVILYPFILKFIILIGCIAITFSLFFSSPAFIAALYIDKDLEFVHTFMNVCFFPRLKVWQT